MSQEAATTTGSAKPAGALPDINAETYPFDLVEHLLNQAAFFNLFSTPEPGKSGGIIRDSSGRITGIQMSEELRRFDLVTQLSPESKTISDVTVDSQRIRLGEDTAALRAINVLGERVGSFRSRWIMVPQDFAWRPGGPEPAPTPLDGSQPQRFVMLEGVCEFGDGGDGFRGYGTGVTYPPSANGTSEVHVAAVGTILSGFGRFAGHEGTYVYGGTLSADRGFTGSLLIRVMDPGAELRTDGTLPEIEAHPPSEHGVTYLLLRGQKRDKYEHTAYSFGSDGQVDGLDVSQQLRIFHLDCTAGRRRGVRSSYEIGPVIGQMTAKIRFNLFNPGAPGTNQAPIPFASYNTYTFFDGSGRRIGSFDADGSEGQTFNMSLSGAPGQKALRFGGVGPILNGTGQFRGIRGLMTDNSVVGVAPHALATSYILRIIDPEGRYRIAFGN
jgi:hypothetical protein